MRVFGLELKRLLSIRKNKILICISVVLSALMAIFPVTFENVYYQETDGTIVDLKGKDAIEYKKNIQKDCIGEVTTEKVVEYLEQYKTIVEQYGDSEEDNFPDNIYYKEILPLEPIIRRLYEISVDPVTCMPDSFLEIDYKNAKQYYEQAQKHLEAVIKLEQDENISAVEHALERYSNVKKPFYISGYYSTNVMDYISFTILLVVLLVILIISPMFSDEYQTNADSILRCTKKGRMQFGLVKCIVSFFVFTFVYWICMFIHLGVSRIFYGTEGLRTSMQAIYSTVSLSNVNIGQLQLIIIVAGFLSGSAVLAFSLFLSAKSKTSATAVAGSVIGIFLPWLIYIALDVNWLSCLLPAGGVVLTSSFYAQITNFNYLHIGEFCIWTPYILITIALIEIPFWVVMAIKGYDKYNTTLQLFEIKDTA